MNEAQLSMLFDRLYKVGKKTRYDAIRAVIIDGMKPSVAERKYEQPVNTISRDVRRLTDTFEFARNLIEAGSVDSRKAESR